MGRKIMSFKPPTTLFPQNSRQNNREHKLMKYTLPGDMTSRTLKEKNSFVTKLPERSPIRTHAGGILLSQEKFTLNPTAGHSGRVFVPEEVKKQPPRPGWMVL